MKFSELVSSSEVLLPGVFNRAVVEEFQFEQFHVKDMLGMDTRIVTASVVSGDNEYKVVVQFNKAHEGCSEESHVQVRCNCPCYRFWFSEANRKVKALFGMHRAKYVPVTEERRQRAPRPPMNPGDVIPGACKHVFVVLKYLKRQGMVEILQE